MERKWDGRTRGGSFGYLFFIRFIEIFGLGPAYFFLCLVVPYFVVFAPAQTRSTFVYSRRILHYSVLRSVFFVFRSYYALGRSLIDRLAVGMGMQDRFVYDIENHSVMLDLVRSDRGGIVIGGHTGAWQMGAPFLGEYGKKLNVVMYDNEHTDIKEIINRYTGGAGFNVIPITDGDISYMFGITSALGKGEVVCFQGDRYINGSQVLRGEFMGVEALFPKGPFLVASKLGVPVVFYFAMRDRARRCHLYFFTPEMMLAREYGVAEEEYLFRAYTAALEYIVRKYPDQWFNYYDFWDLYSGR